MKRISRHALLVVPLATLLVAAPSLLNAGKLVSYDQAYAAKGGNGGGKGNGGGGGGNGNGGNGNGGNSNGGNGGQGNSAGSQGNSAGSSKSASLESGSTIKGNGKAKGKG